ncbi:unnamed protein product [Prorocentrum cordatum]|uniref:FACT complex subunit n=1 Tax=Prorocentrum cordatum TaxID=2364126 RepID=A0ABN9RWA6_9DINO|nr:unnamed protein product [Polarella glacialis]
MAQPPGQKHVVVGAVDSEPPGEKDASGDTGSEIKVESATTDDPPGRVKKDDKADESKKDKDGKDEKLKKDKKDKSHKKDAKEKKDKKSSAEKLEKKKQLLALGEDAPKGHAAYGRVHFSAPKNKFFFTQGAPPNKIEVAVSVSMANGSEAMAGRIARLCYVRLVDHGASKEELVQYRDDLLKLSRKIPVGPPLAQPSGEGAAAAGGGAPGEGDAAKSARKQPRPTGEAAAATGDGAPGDGGAVKSPQSGRGLRPRRAPTAAPRRAPARLARAALRGARRSGSGARGRRRPPDRRGALRPASAPPRRRLPREA